MARDFDGVDDGAQGLVDADMSTALTIAAWIKPANVGSDFGRMVNVRDSGNVEQVAIFNDAQKGEMKIQLTDGAGNKKFGGSHPLMVMDGRWYWWSTRWASGGGVNTLIYNEDGSLFSDTTTSAVTTTLRDAAGGSLTVGHSGGGASDWGGVVARLFVHNAYLTDEQMTSLRLGTVPVVPSADYWSFNDETTPETGDVHGTPLEIVGATVVSGAGLPPIPKAYAGSTTPTGALTPRVNKVFAAAVAAAGVVDVRKIVTIVLSGSTAAAGALTKAYVIVKAGSAKPAGVLAKTAQKALVGQSAATGSILRVVKRILTSTIALTSTLAPRSLGRIRGRAGSATMVFKSSVGEVRLRFRRS